VRRHFIALPPTSNSPPGTLRNPNTPLKTQFYGMRELAFQEQEGWEITLAERVKERTSAEVEEVGRR